MWLTRARLPGAVRRRVQRRGLGAGANLTTRVYIIQPAAAVAAAVQRTGVALSRARVAAGR